MHVIVIIIHASGASPATFPCRIDILERKVLSHSIRRRHVGGDGARGQDRLESLDLLGGHWAFIGAIEALGELDVELDVEISVVVVSEGRHTLFADDLYSACYFVSLDNFNG
jgi:hypothetical protein